MNPPGTLPLTTSTLTTIIIGASLFTYALLRTLEFAIRELNRRGKARILWLDKDGGILKLTYHTRQGNEIITGKGDKTKKYILQADSAIPSTPPTWILHPRHGWTLTPPADSEALKDGLLRRLIIWNPSSYFQETKRNKTRDGLTANDPDEKAAWIPTAIVVVGILVLGCFGMIAWVVYHIIESGAMPGG